MKKRILKLIALALVVLTAFSVVGCGGCDWSMFDALFEIQPEVPSGEWESSNGNSLVTDKERGTQYWTEPPFTIILPPPLDFEGMKILFLTIDQDYYKREFYGVSYPDREGEEISLEEALAVRNDLVGETLNIEVDLEFAGADVESARANIADMIAKDLASDLQSYDVLNLPDTIVTSLAIRDHNANLLDEEVFPYFDFEMEQAEKNDDNSRAPRFPWFKSLVNLHPNARLNYVAGPMNFSAIDNVNMIWYNESLYKENIEAGDYKDVQQLALDQKWTYDELYKIAGRYQSDDGDGYAIGFDADADKGKQYPMADAFRQAWNIEWTNENPDGTFFLTADNNSLAEEAYMRLKELYALDSTKKNGSVDDFVEGKYIFFVSKLSPSAEATEKLLNMDYLNGLLPMPKYNDKQSDYEFTTSGGTVLSVLNHSGVRAEGDKGEGISAYLQLTAEETLGVYGYHIMNTVRQNWWGTDGRVYPYGYNIRFYGMICNNLKYRFTDVYSSHIGEISSLWSDAFESDSPDIITEYNKKKDSYEESLTDLNLWFGLIIIDEIT